MRKCSSLDAAAEVIKYFLALSLLVQFPVLNADDFELGNGEMKTPFSSLQSLIHDDLKGLLARAFFGRDAFDSDLIWLFVASSHVVNRIS